MLGILATMWRPLHRTGRRGAQLRWLSARTWTARWYPQGIDVGTFDARRTLAVSWFRQDRQQNHLASRVALIDLDRARHLDVFLAIADADGTLQPARIHAGGLAWFGDRLFVAATREGIWEFDLGTIRKVKGETARRVRGSKRKGLRDIALVITRTRVHPVDLRCSFIGRTFDANGNGEQRVLIGEYSRSSHGRIGEFTVAGTESTRVLQQVDEFVPNISHMQGVVRLGETYYASQSDDLNPGTLWSGTRENLRRSGFSLPVGCEDLALDLAAGRLWTIGEHPWRRVVKGIALSELKAKPAGR